MAGKGISRSVIDFLVERSGLPASIDLVSDELGFTKPQISQALSKLVADGVPGVVRVSSGVYAYAAPAGNASRPVTAPANDSAHMPSYTFIGNAKDGSPLVRDSGGTIYKLTAV
jgi:hypothetical protein